MSSDTIVALGTPPGVAALACLRVSGDDAHALAKKLARRELPARCPVYCNLYHDENFLDDAVVTLWQAPASYTGENMAEITCHGNPLIADRILQACCVAGARLAHPGEFTQRAFLNGKMDLTQAEAVMDLISAKSERALRAAAHIRQGALGQTLLQHRETLLQLLAHLEAYIDFPEDDIQPDIGQNFLEKIVLLQNDLAKLLSTADEGRKLREGLRVAIVGAPNAGKSTLLNALLGHDRAIVSEHPGTTRDTVEEILILEGIQLRLIDTAGLRADPDTIEKLGIQRALQAIETADLVLILFDGTQTHPPAPLPIPCHQPYIACITKSDLPIAYRGEGLKISALTGKGLPELKNLIVQKLKLAESPQSRELILINTRHEILLRQALAALDRARVTLQTNAPPEITSADLRDALRALGEIVGEATNDDILDRLFKTFCIGK